MKAICNNVKNCFILLNCSNFMGFFLVTRDFILANLLFSCALLLSKCWSLVELQMQMEFGAKYYYETLS